MSKQNEATLDESKEKTQTPEPSREVAPANNIGSGLAVIDLNAADELPDLDQADEVPIDLTVNYWTPEKEGEQKRVFFDRVEDTQTIDQDSGEVKELRSAFFFERTEDGAVQTICNASKRLVAAMEENGIRRGTPLKVTYIGKKKNKTNSYSSDRWRVTPLRIEI